MKGFILSLCDHTGNWSRPYEEAGYDVIRVDLQDGKDVRLLERLDYPIRGILAAPPCTAFSKAGAWKWAEKGDQALTEGLSIVDACLRIIYAHRPHWWALENPAGRLRRYLGPHAFSFDPCDYGGLVEGGESEAYTKRTYLWGNFVPPVPLLVGCLSAVAPTRGDVTTRVRNTRNRSATPMGFAKAFFLANP